MDSSQSSNTPPSDTHWPASPLTTSSASRWSSITRFVVVASRRLQQAWHLVTLDRIRRMAGLVRDGEADLVVSAFKSILNGSVASGVTAQTQNDEVIPSAPLPAEVPLVSVIIPCFNYGRFVTACIESVLAQTLHDVEIIVVDGGSDDPSTIDVLRKLDEPRTTVILREGRHLVGDNRNFGIAMARGRFICCLDADDTIAPTYLEKAIFIAETYGYDVVSSAMNFIGAKSGFIGILPYPTLADEISGNHICTCAVFRRSLWHCVGGFWDTGLGTEHTSEDWDFWMRLAAYGARIRNISGEGLFNYRVHADASLSTLAGVPSLKAQGTLIRERNKTILTREAFRLSKLQRDRRLRAAPTKTALATSLFVSDEMFIHHSAPTLLLVIPAMVFGGAEKLLSTVVAHLRRNGWRIVIISTTAPGSTTGDTSDWFTALTDEVYCLPLFLPPYEWQDFVNFIFATRCPDVAMNCGSTFFYSIINNIRVSNTNTAMVDMLFNITGHTKSHLENKAAFDLALCENATVAEWYRRIGWKADRICLVPSGVDTCAYAPRSRAEGLVKSLGIRDDQIVIGFSGRLSEEKAPDIFMKIAALSKNIPNVRFIMTGVGRLEKRIRSMQADLPPSVRFDFLGNVDSIVNLLSLYDLLVLPSLIDGRPLIVMEAQACGIPVIASSVGGLPELIIDGHTGFLCRPGDAADFAARIKEAVTTPARLRAMKTAARASAVERFDGNRFVQDYERALRQAISLKVKLDR